MDKVERLRGRSVFARIHTSGQRVEAGICRCMFVLDRSHAGKVFVAFTVPSAGLPAVRRNRIRRLMREAFRHERDVLLQRVVGRDDSIQMILRYAGGKAGPTDRPMLAPFRRDIAAVCRALAARLT